MARLNRDGGFNEHPVETLRSKFSYDAETGILTRRVACGKFAAGSVVGSMTDGGYLITKLDRRCYLVARIIWAMVEGVWPVSFVDHRDRVRSNNRWSNLRIANKTQNNVNSLRKRKSDLPRGAYKYGRRFGSYIRENGHKKWLGSFDAPEQAAAAYAVAAKRLHGEFAPI